MADLHFTVPSGEVSLTGGTAKTVVTVKAPANQRVFVHEILLGFEGIVVTERPVLVELVRGTAATAGTNTAVTPVPVDAGADETIQSTGAKAYTAEPTVLTAVRQVTLHPQAQWSYIPEAPIPVKGGQVFGVRLTSATAENQTVVATLVCEE